MQQRVPPNNEEAEQSVLGCMLLDRDAIFRASERLEAADFYREANARIFQAIVDLNNAGQPVDLLTLTEELRRRAQLDGVGGIAYVTSLLNVVPSAAHLDTYLRIVLEKSVLRQLSATAGRLLTRVHESGDPVDEIVADAERQILEIGQRRTDRNFQSLKQVLDSTLDQIEYIHNNQGRLRGVPTGFPDLDNLTAGFQASDLIILAARPSMGKTQLGLNFAAQATVEAGKTCAIFSLEMSAEQLAMRLLAAEARIDSQRLRSGQLLDEHWKRLGQALIRLQDAKLYIDDTPGISVMEMRARARRLKQEAGLDLIIVDYLQLMSGRARAESRQQEISEISRNLKALARELHVPVIALSQLSRAVESRQDKRPMLSDLRECVTGDTLVALATGETKPIAELVGETPQVITVDERQLTFASATATRVWAVGERPVFALTTSSGRTTRATANHPFLTGDGWTTLEALAPGTRIAVPARAAATDMLAGRTEVAWDEVKAIEPAGTELVYDMAVPGTHNFVANGIVVHNSGAIEQDADLVAFIYRDDYYNPDTDRPNVTEVIIAKQRNGPVGKVELVFLKEYGTFASLDRRHDGAAD